jgi:hypothetical protein
MMDVKRRRASSIRVCNNGRKTEMRLEAVGSFGYCGDRRR